MVFAAIAGTVAVVAFSIAGLRASVPSGPNVPADRPVATTTVNGITISHPEEWFVVDPDEIGLNGPEATTDLPRLVLALAPTRPEEALACPGLAGGTRPTFLMTVQERPLALTGAAAVPWPVDLERQRVLTAEVACYPGWEILHAEWTAERRTFVAQIGLAPDVGTRDRGALLEAFASMTFAPASGGPASAVLATGTAGGEDWELIAERQPDGLSLALQGQSFGAGTGGFDPTADALQVTDQVFGEGAAAERVTFGAVPVHVVRIVASDGSSPSRDIAILDVPDEIDARLDAFLVIQPADRPWHIELLDAAGQVVAQGDVGRVAPPGTELEDGRHFGFVRSVDVAGRTIAFDPASWLSGEEADRAYQEATGMTGGVPNDYYIVNDDLTPQTLSLSPDLRLRLLDWSRCCDTFFDGELAIFADAVNTGGSVADGDRLYQGTSLWWVTVADGVVTEIEEQYTP